MSRAPSVGPVLGARVPRPQMAPSSKSYLGFVLLNVYH